ncbi:putative NAD(P)-binding-domain-containing protein [Melampsora americana]|nr:putative NAD(P)-binding-domain-containing protein [Melampsora americana]
MSSIETSLPICIALQLTDRPVTLIGGGNVAASRLVYLIQAQARITLIAPRTGLSKEVSKAIDEGKIWKYHNRTYSNDQDDLKDAFVVLTAVDDESVGREVAKICRARSILVNVADVPPQCDFYFGSIIRRGPVQIMISTNGKAPRLASQLRKTMEKNLPSNLEKAIANVDTIRSRLRERVSSQDRSSDRMSWMIKLCDRWSWEELAELDNEQIEMILQAAWENDEDVEMKDRKVLTKQLLLPWWRRKPFVDEWRRCPMSKKWRGDWLCPGTIGFLLGMSTTALYIIARSKRIG